MPPKPKQSVEDGEKIEKSTETVEKKTKARRPVKEVSESDSDKASEHTGSDEEDDRYDDRRDDRDERDERHERPRYGKSPSLSFDYDRYRKIPMDGKKLEVKYIGDLGINELLKIVYVIANDNGQFSVKSAVGEIMRALNHEIAMPVPTYSSYRGGRGGGRGGGGRGGAGGPGLTHRDRR